MTKTLVLEGDITAVDTATNLTTQGSVSAPSLVVPTEVSKIDKVKVDVVSDHVAAGSASYLVRLAGNAVQGGEAALIVAAEGGQLPQAGSDTAPSVVLEHMFEDADIPVKHDTIRVQAEMMGSDLGTARVVVTLYFA